MTTRLVTPAKGPVEADVRVPGSKSVTNRALVCAALAEGRSTMDGALVADDTEAMVGGLRALGRDVAVQPIGDDLARIVVEGATEAPDVAGATIDARLSGTTARFLIPVAALGAGPHRIVGGQPLRNRPMAPGLDAVRGLGADVVALDAAGHLPVEIRGPARGGTVPMSGDVSSQFLSGLLLAGPSMPAGVCVEVGGPQVSEPYLAMTASVMSAFGVQVEHSGGRWSVEAGSYRATDLVVEPDASAATYVFAAAVITGGRVRVGGLTRSGWQGDVGFVDVLARMGADVSEGEGGIEVSGGRALHGVDVDLGAMSDTAQTLAAVAVFAEGPTRITGIGFTRAKETDRVGHVVGELRRLGIDAVEEADGFIVHPGTPSAGVVQTHDDHRMAMAFALLGLRAPGIEIADPTVVTKTWPGYWATLERLTP